MNLRAALHLLLDQVDYTNGACTVTEQVGAVLPKDVIQTVKAALAAPFGLALEQEPKYTINDDGRIINRATEIPIPDDEPVMIFRAKDVLARPTIRRYVDMVAEETPAATHHRNVCFDRYQSFIAFADQHPERMKSPDTEPKVTG